MLIIHLTTGARKGIIVELLHAQLNTEEVHLDSAITRAFNKTMNTNLTTSEIKQKHYVNKYDRINFYDNGNYFNLEMSMSEFSLKHKTSDYIFVQESLLLAEVNNRKSKRVVSLDFETATGKRASVCSIGYVVEENGEIIKEEEILVNPATKFSPMTIKIHGITPIDVANSPTWDKVWPSVQEYITDDTLVIGHNLRNTELSCIRQECERYGMEIPEFAKRNSTKVYDTLRLSQKLNKDLDNHKLSTLADKYNIELNHHNALSDARACLELFNIFQKTLDFSSLDLDQPLNKPKSSSKNRFHPQYSKTLTPNTSDFDKSHILYNKKIILTGSFDNLSRKDASQIILDLGGMLGERVTLDTNYLVLSNTSFTELQDGKMTTKTKKACEYRDKGIDINIISEDNFLELIGFSQVSI